MAREAAAASPGATRAAVILPWERLSGRGGERTAEARLAEAIGLVVVHTEIVPLRAPRLSTLLGEGQVAEIGRAVAERAVELTVVDAALGAV